MHLGKERTVRKPTLVLLTISVALLVATVSLWTAGNPIVAGIATPITTLAAILWFFQIQKDLNVRGLYAVAAEALGISKIIHYRPLGMIPWVYVMTADVKRRPKLVLSYDRGATFTDDQGKVHTGIFIVEGAVGPDSKPLPATSANVNPLLGVEKDLPEPKPIIGRDKIKSRGEGREL